MTAATRKDQQGVIAVEVAILMPVALLFLFMIIEFGLFFLYLGRLQIATYNSARYAAEQWQPVDNTELEAKIKRVAVYGVPIKTERPLLPNLTEQNVALTFPLFGKSDQEHVKVRIEYNYQPIFPLNSFFNVDSFKTMNVESVMRILT